MFTNLYSHQQCLKILVASCHHECGRYSQRGPHLMPESGTMFPTWLKELGDPLEIQLLSEGEGLLISLALNPE